MIVVIATLQAKAEHAPEVAAGLRALERHTRTEPGAIVYSVLQQPGNRFVIFERYADQAAHDAHFAADYLTEFLTRTRTLLVTEASMESGTELAGFARPDPAEPGS